MRRFYSLLFAVRSPIIGSALLGVFLLGYSIPAIAQVQHETSEITGEERVSSTGLRDTDVQSYVGSDIAYKVEYTYRPNTEQESWSITFYGFADQPTDMARTDRVLTWMNGQRRQLDNATARTRQIDGEVMEIQTVTLSASLFRRMATVEMVQFTIGSAEFDLPYDYRADMRAVLEHARDITSAEAQQQRADKGS